MRSILILLFSLICINGFAQGRVTLQNKPFIYNQPVDSSILQTLASDSVFQRLPSNEQWMFYWVNVFRKNPKRFFSTVVSEFIRQFPEANKPEVKSLEKDIDKVTGSLPLFIPDAGLTRMSLTHANDLRGRGGILSHKSSSGKDFVQRIKEAGSYNCGAENIFIGNNNPLEALVMLLIDYGVPDKAHRLNLLDPGFGRMGLSFSQTATNKTILVQEFACK